MAIWDQRRFWESRRRAISAGRSDGCVVDVLGGGVEVALGRKRGRARVRLRVEAGEGAT